MGFGVRIAGRLVPITSRPIGDFRKDVAVPSVRFAPGSMDRTLQEATIQRYHCGTRPVQSARSRLPALNLTIGPGPDRLPA